MVRGVPVAVVRGVADRGVAKDARNVLSQKVAWTGKVVLLRDEKCLGKYSPEPLRDIGNCAKPSCVVRISLVGRRLGYWAYKPECCYASCPGCTVSESVVMATQRKGAETEDEGFEFRTQLLPYKPIASSVCCGHQGEPVVFPIIFVCHGWGHFQQSLDEITRSPALVTPKSTLTTAAVLTR